MNTPTVIQYVLSRLREIGITDVFGVPGDYSFPINDAICNRDDIRWIGCSNELNAAYAADGYARIRGAAAVCTTYGVGELSAINGIAGAYAEHLPVFHLVGAPNSRTQFSRALMHHTLGTGEYNLFQKMTEPVVCAQAVMTPQNAIFETERLIGEALYHRRPVYMSFPGDYANMPVVGSPQPAQVYQSDPLSLKNAVDHILEALDKANTACVLAGILVARTNQKDALQSVVDAAGLPFATMFMGKSVLEEAQPAFVGMYDGRLMNEEVRNFVESCECILNAGALMTDFNSGAFTANLDHARVIQINHHHVKAGGKTYPNVEIGDVLHTLAARLSHRLGGWPKPKLEPQPKLEPNPAEKPDTHHNGEITAPALYPRWENFFKEQDIIIAETGTVSMGLGFAKMPIGATFHNQTLWGSIGWATPAAFGAAIAAPGKRLILLTGDGAHQFTAQEIGQFYRYAVNPIIFVLNNAGYLIERLLCTDPETEYNDIAGWRYADLPQAFGCEDWYTKRVTTCEELDLALEIAAKGEKACYIEVVTDAYAASPLSLKLHETFRNLYKV